MTTVDILPEADHYCMADDLWSFTRLLVAAEIAKAEKRGRESMRQECVKVCDKWIKAAKDDTAAVGIALAQQEVKELK